MQVEKEERGNKGAALTTFVSLAGRYVVLMPNNPRGGGVSRRIEGDEREELKEAMDQLEYPKGMSLIARTAGIGRTAAELQWDLNYMLKLWTAIDEASGAGKGAYLIYQESSLVIRAIRDYFTNDIGEILIDTDDIYEQAKQFMLHVMPDQSNRVKRYRDDAALFARFQIEQPSAGEMIFRGLLAPRLNNPPRPPEGRTLIRSRPIEANCRLICWRTPSASDTITTKVSVPTTTPSEVRAVRSLRRRRLARAVKA